MPNARKVPVVWNTGFGGPGLSVFYSADPDDATASLGTYFNAIKALFPNGVSWVIPGAGDLIDIASGRLTGGWTGGTAATINGTGGVATYAAGCGTYVKWLTGTIVNFRALKGKTFLVPLTAATYDSDGTLQPAHVTTLQNAANALVAAGKIAVYHRPTGFAGGALNGVTAAQQMDRVTSLKTRRS